MSAFILDDCTTVFMAVSTMYHHGRIALVICLSQVYNPNEDANTYACTFNEECTAGYFCDRTVVRRCTRLLKVAEACKGPYMCETGACRLDCARQGPQYCRFTCQYAYPPPSPPPSPPPPKPQQPDAPFTPAPLAPAYCEKTEECLRITSPRPSICQDGLCKWLRIGDEACSSDNECASGLCWWRCAPPAALRGEAPRCTAGVAVPLCKGSPFVRAA